MCDGRIVNAPYGIELWSYLSANIYGDLHIKCILRYRARNTAKNH